RVEVEKRRATFVAADSILCHPVTTRCRLHATTYRQHVKLVQFAPIDENPRVAVGCIGAKRSAKTQPRSDTTRARSALEAPHTSRRVVPVAARLYRHAVGSLDLSQRRLVQRHGVDDNFIRGLYGASRFSRGISADNLRGSCLLRRKVAT